MRTIKKLINTEKKVYILLKNKAIQYRFMSDAEREGITYGDNVIILCHIGHNVIIVMVGIAVLKKFYHNILWGQIIYKFTDSLLLAVVIANTLILLDKSAALHNFYGCFVVCRADSHHFRDTDLFHDRRQECGKR